MLPQPMRMQRPPCLTNVGRLRRSATVLLFAYSLAQFVSDHHELATGDAVWVKQTINKNIPVLIECRNRDGLGGVPVVKLEVLRK